MIPDSSERAVSTLLVDESFAAADDQFVARVRTVASAKYLAALADRWKKDPRPWARQQIFDYLALPLDRPGHHPIVKRLFKQAEANRDTELMAAFLVAFDRLIRRKRRICYRYDWQTRQSWQDEELFSPRDQIFASMANREAVDPRTGERISVPPRRIPRNGQLFSYKTRGYLRRRVCRYFRRMGFQRPADYPQAVAHSLALFRDADLARGENMLDSWSLMSLAFRGSAVLEFKRTRVELKEGCSLAGLIAAPRFPDLWKRPESAAVLLKLVVEAQSRLASVWAMQLLNRDHAQALRAIRPEQLRELLDHNDPEVQQFAASLLETIEGTDRWPIATWLDLLETRSVTALATICQAMTRHVNAERLTLEQCVALACARATPVARLGLSCLAGRAVTTEQDRAMLLRLADAKCEAIGVEAAQQALSILGVAPNYSADQAAPFFDSLNLQVREGAWAWLTPECPGYSDPALWSRLLETPFDDVRLRLVAELNQRTREVATPPALRSQDLAQVWTTVLLGIHRGGRAKLTALRQISQAIAEQPDRAEQLIPVLAVAIRSVRPPEARAGLSAILTAISRRPELETTLAQLIPELRLSPQSVAP